jgi:hypothetical protein
MQAQAEYERQQRLKRESNMTIGLIVGAIAGAAVASIASVATPASRFECRAFIFTLP